ncbi:NIS1 [Auxenochlorella protothecoides x Auxenochlorella symbiontica]
MYPHLLDSDACVRLLHRNGSAGCSTPGNSAVEGNLWRLSDRDMEAGSGQHIPRGSVAVLPAAALEDFLASLSADAAWASHWAGALVLAHAPGTHLPSNPLPASGALWPGSEAEAPSHAWNPAGTGSVLRALPFPLFSLNASASERVAATLSRAPSTGAGPSPAARMDVRMAVPAGATSEACLAARTCLPLGGHTVWARVGPRGSRPAPVLVAAVQDEASLFHAGGGAGAHAGASGLIATLAAARALGRRPPAAGRAPIVFAAFAGEAWGALGSRRLLYQAAGGDADALDPARPARLLEVGRVGCVPGALHVHGADRGTLGTLRAAAAAVPGLRLAEASVGGLPPGSAAQSYRRVHPDLPLAVLTDYDAAWPSDAGTPTDGLDRLDVRALAAAAELVARAAHAWASSAGGDGDGAPGLGVDADSLERDVAQLLACFGPQGLACPLAAAVLRGGAGPGAGPPSSYVGILRSLTKDSQASDPLVKGARERFLLGYLAYAAAGIRPEAEGYVPRGRPCSAASELQCPGGGVCVGAQTQDRSSECLNVTAKYVPAYPTALECRACDGQRAGGEGWHFTDAAATWEASFGWPEEDVWAESNWPTGTPSLSLLLRESAAREQQVLLAGVGVALLCVAGVALLQKQARGWLPGAAGGDG